MHQADFRLGLLCQLCLGAGLYHHRIKAAVGRVPVERIPAHLAAVASSAWLHGGMLDLASLLVHQLEQFIARHIVALLLVSLQEVRGQLVG